MTEYQYHTKVNGEISLMRRLYEVGTNADSDMLIYAKAFILNPSSFWFPDLFYREYAVPENLPNMRGCQSNVASEASNDNYQTAERFEDKRTIAWNHLWKFYTLSTAKAKQEASIKLSMDETLCTVCYESWTLGSWDNGRHHWGRH